MGTEKRILGVALALALVASVAGALAGTTGLSTQQARTAAPDGGIGFVNAEGTSLAFARADHQHLNLTPGQVFRNKPWAACRMGRVDLSGAATGYGCFGFTGGVWSAYAATSGTTSSGTNSGYPNASQFVNVNTSAAASGYVVLADPTGINGTSFGSDPAFFFYGGIAQTTSTAIFVGLSPAASLYLETYSASTTNAAFGTVFAALAYDSASGSGNWLCCAGNGTTAGCTASSIVATTGALHTLGVYVPTGFSAANDNVQCSVDGTTFTRPGSSGTSPNASAFGAAGPHVTMISRTTAAKTFYYGDLTLESY